MRKLALSKNVVDFLNELQSKQFKQVMAKILSLLGEPTPPDSQQLKGFDDRRRTDIGEFRIIYRFDETTLAVSLVGKRNDDEFTNDCAICCADRGVEMAPKISGSVPA